MLEKNKLQASASYLRTNVSYAVGDPYSVFDYIPHVVHPDGSVTVDQDAIEAMWRATHDFEPFENWRLNLWTQWKSEVARMRQALQKDEQASQGQQPEGE